MTPNILGWISHFSCGSRAAPHRIQAGHVGRRLPTIGVSAMGNTLLDKTVVVVGRGSGIARAITLLARSEGARVIVAGRDQAKLAGAYSDSGVTAEVVDITDDDSIAALADR